MKNVLEYLEHTAARIPDKRAVTDQSGSFSFRELEQKAGGIGSFLADRTRPGQPVGLCMEKSKEALAAMLGIVYAGCFSVYLNAEQGELRLRKMVRTAGIRLVLTDRPEETERLLNTAYEDEAPENIGKEKAAGAPENAGAEAGMTSGEIRIVCLRVQDALSCPVNDGALARIRLAQTDTDPLYCNFTSGSTGTPKGVLVCHRSVIDFMNYFPELFHITEDDVIGNQAPFDFDVSVKDIYTSLKTGAELVLIPRKYFTVITSLMDYLDDHRVTTLIWAVSALCLTVQFRGFSYKVPKAVRHVLFSGEVMPQRFLDAWMKQYPDAEFVNLYGPSEITCNCTYWRIPRSAGQSQTTAQDAEEKERAFRRAGLTETPAQNAEAGEHAPRSTDLAQVPVQNAEAGEGVPRSAGVMPIGRAFPNEKVFLLDEKNRRITEPGRTGEICVCGSCLALGYLNAPEATEKAFCRNPLTHGYPERMYRTGDLGYFREDGELCFSGRADFQIKLFGHRIELEEVEMALNAASGVERGFCVFNREKNRLEGYYCGPSDPRMVKGELRRLLPQYMVPSRLHQVPEIPVNEHGKMDRRKVLAEADTQRQEAGS